MMDVKLKILMLEDDPNDRDLVIYHLNKGGINYTSLVVQTEEDFEDALKNFSPDVIVSDFSLPSYNGLEAFNLKQQISPNIPFIIVSGTIGEERAVELIKSGITDYLVKDRVISLPYKITRAIREAKDKEEKYRAEQEILILNAELEERVQLRTAELEIANKQLESFTSIVSHDLRAPLQVIIGYASILGRKYNDDLTDDGKQLLQGIKEHTRQMGQLIDDLLNFSKLGRTEPVKKVVDMNELVQAAVNQLRSGDEKMNARFRFLELEPAYGDRSLVHQVWINLISNAVKYSKNEIEPVIEIGMQKMDGEDVYYVKDNGAGFDMQHYDKLFGVFQRLHKSSEFEGTGVGLAMVYAVITKHGGRIWAESKLNGGATFYFTLPPALVENSTAQTNLVAIS
jgi:two-component system sensor histidine kinase/response regulator